MSDAAVTTVPIQPAKALEAPAAEQSGGEKSWDEIRDTAVAEDKKAKAEAAKEAEKPAKPKDGAPAEQKDRKVKYTEWQTYEHKVAKLNQREREFNAREAKGREDFGALEKRTAEVEAREKKLASLETDPKAFIQHFADRVGMSPTKVVNALNDFFLDNKTPADLEIAKMKKDLEDRDTRAAEERKKAEAEQGQRARQQKVQGYKNTIADTVRKTADNYTFIPAYTPEQVADAAWDRIEKHHAQTGQNLSLDKVLAILENEERAQFLRMQEFSNKRQPAGAEKVGGVPNREGAAPAANHDAQQRPTTLNHRLAGQRTPQPRGQSDQEDWEEAKRQAGMAR